MVPSAIIIVCTKENGSSQLALSIATKWPPRYGPKSSTRDWLRDEEAVLNTSIFSNIVGMWIELPRIIIQLRLIIHIKPIYISFTTGIHFRMKCSYILIAILWNGLIALIISLLEGAWFIALKYRHGNLSVVGQLVSPLGSVIDMMLSGEGRINFRLKPSIKKSDMCI